VLLTAYFIGECFSAKSSVDDLGTCRGVVLSRAATILRSIETYPLTGRFVISQGDNLRRLLKQLPL
jgi:hypothetical protein